jgi:hypothetical protein
MLLRSATVFLLAFVILLSSHIPFRLSAQEKVERSTERNATEDMPPTNCKVTLPSDGVYEPPPSPEFGPSRFFRTPSQFYFGTDKLWTTPPTDGTWRGPDLGGTRDFVYSDKLPWYRTPGVVSEKTGPLTIKGKRLDGPAPFFVETNEDFQYNPGGIMGGISIPADGCWQITGHYGDQDLTFTVWVTSLTKQKFSSQWPSSEILPEQSVPTVALPRVHVDGQTAARALVYKVLPETPTAARETNTYGAVVLQVVIGTDGRTQDVRYIAGPQVLVQAAMEAVRWYQYRLPVVDTEPHTQEEVQEVDTIVTVQFPPPSD